MRTTYNYLTIVSALVVSVGDVVVAGPCGFGALCGRPSCDSAVMTQYKQALPAIKACEASINWPAFWSAKTADEFMAQCFNAPCGVALADITRFADVEATVCELHYPTRETNLLSGEFVSNCIQSRLPEVKAEADKRLGRGGSPATTTPSPSAPRSTTTSPSQTPSPVPTVVIATLVPTATPQPTTPASTPIPVTSLPSTRSSTPSSSSASSASSGSQSSSDDTSASVETVSATTATPVSTLSRRPSLAPSPTSSSSDPSSWRIRSYGVVTMSAIIAWLQM